MLRYLVYCFCMMTGIFVLRLSTYWLPYNVVKLKVIPNYLERLAGKEQFMTRLFDNHDDFLFIGDNILSKPAFVFLSQLIPKVPVSTGLFVPCLTPYNKASETRLRD